MPLRADEQEPRACSTVIRRTVDVELPPLLLNFFLLFLYDPLGLVRKLRNEVR